MNATAMPENENAMPKPESEATLAAPSGSAYQRRKDIMAIFRVPSRLVRQLKGGDVARCPNCNLLPIEVSYTSKLGVPHHRFECPECGGDNHVRWMMSHKDAAAAWNAWANPPNEKLTDGSAKNQ